MLKPLAIGQAGFGKEACQTLRELGTGSSGTLVVEKATSTDPSSVPYARPEVTTKEHRANLA